jgi:hypothetical protein
MNNIQRGQVIKSHNQNQENKIYICLDYLQQNTYIAFSKPKKLLFYMVSVREKKKNTRRHLIG